MPKPVKSAPNFSAGTKRNGKRNETNPTITISTNPAKRALLLGERKILVDAAKTPEAIIATRNLLILSKVMFTLEPELLEKIAKSVPDRLAQAKAQKPLSLWQMFKKMCSHDTRRALSTMLNVLESFGKSLGPRNAVVPNNQ